MQKAINVALNLSLGLKPALSIQHSRIPSYSLLHSLVVTHTLCSSSFVSHDASRAASLIRPRTSVPSPTRADFYFPHTPCAAAWICIMELLAYNQMSPKEWRRISAALQKMHTKKMQKPKLKLHLRMKKKQQRPWMEALLAAIMYNAANQ